MAASVKAKEPKKPKAKPRKAVLKKPPPKKAGRDAKMRAANDDSEPPKFEGNNELMPTPDVVKKTAAAVADEKQKLSVISGRIGAIIKNAEKDHNVHRGAMAHTIKLAKMTPEAREEFIRHERSYRLAMGWGEQADLINDLGHESAPAQ